MHDATEQCRSAITRAHRAALEACDPCSLVHRHWRAEFDRPTRLFVLGIGKASAGMLQAVGERRPDAVGLGVVVPGVDVGGIPKGIELFETDHPIPTRRNVEAAKHVAAFARSLGPSDRLLVLLSGGGSAQLCLPREGLTLEDLQDATRQLIRAGTPIDALNAVRRRLDRLKGGGLASLIAARTTTLAISDVGEHGPETVSSGPMHPPPAGDDQRLASDPGVDALPRKLRDIVRGPQPGPQPPLPDDFVVMANYSTAVDAARASLAGLGLEDHSPGGFETGAAAEVGARWIAASGGGGWYAMQGCELRVDASSGDGVGGRAQECALAAAIALDGTTGFAVGALSTDGVDGPTSAAGAIVDGGSAGRMRSAGLDPADSLARHDSHPALAASGDLIVTGPTGTNVNDLLIAVALR